MIWFIFSVRFTRASHALLGPGTGRALAASRSIPEVVLPTFCHHTSSCALHHAEPCPQDDSRLKVRRGILMEWGGYSKKWSSLPPRWTYTVPYSTSKMNRSNNELTLFDGFHYVSSMLGGLQRNSTILINGISTRIDQLHTWSIAVAILMHGIWICMVHDVTLSRHSPTNQGPSKTTPSKSPVISA